MATFTEPSTVFKFLSCLCLVLLRTLCFLSQPSKSRKAPNFVVFIVDDLGIGDIGCFGNDTIKTPNIDNLASQGVKLNHNLAPASLCTPSRAATLTGRYAVRSGFAANLGEKRVLLDLAVSGGLPQNETTIAEILKMSGYRTGLIGKWHLGLNCEKNDDSCHNPLNAGFHEYYGLPFTNVRGQCTRPEDGVFQLKRMEKKSKQLIYATVALVIAMWILRILSRKNSLLLILIVAGSTRFMMKLIKTNFPKRNCVLMRNFDVVEQPVKMDNLTLRFTREAQHFIERSKRQPFFLLVSYAKVHTSLFTMPRFHGHSAHGNYGDNVEEMDWSVGEIVSSLREENLLEDTLVYFTSDHGPHLEETVDSGEYCGGWRGLYKGGKGQNWEGGIRVPTVVMWKSHLPEGDAINEPTSTMDIFRTMSNLADGKIPEDRLVDSKDILPLLKQEETISPHEFLFHYCGSSIHAVRYRPRTGNNTWKTHFVTPNWKPGKQECNREKISCGCFGDVTQHDPPLLYDITNDPYENTPLDAMKHGDIVAKIQEAIASHKAGVKRVPSQLTTSNNAWKPSLQPCCNFPFCACSE